MLPSTSRILIARLALTHCRTLATQPYKYTRPPPPPQTWLTTYLNDSPKAMALFTSLTGAIGVNSPKQVAGRHCHSIYQNHAAKREAEQLHFWRHDCRLPPTFQTWFTVTNLHVWMLTVRLRALPPPDGTHYVQGLVDHFFLDVEDRIRANLSEKAPERLVTRQMKIFREQWHGLGLAFDYALSLSAPPADGDVEMAAAVWRNLLGARGARGIDNPGTRTVRPALNPSGDGDTPNPPPSRPEHHDDGSGVHDFTGPDTALYVTYPELMYDIIAYVRRELVRLERVPDQQILDGLGTGAFGAIRGGQQPAEENAL